MCPFYFEKIPIDLLLMVRFQEVEEREASFGGRLDAQNYPI